MDVMTPERQLDRLGVAEFVAGDAVDELIARADRELSDLEARASKELALAERLEATLVLDGVDQHMTTWSLVRLHTFLDRMLLELSAELHASVGVARRAAQHPTSAFSDLRWSDETGTRATAPAPLPATEPEAASTGSEPAFETGVLAAADQHVATDAAGPRLDEDAIPATHVDDAWADLFFAPDGAPAEEADIEAIASASPDQTFWTEEPAAHRSFFLRRRASTVLQIGAGVLVAAAAVLRFA